VLVSPAGAVRAREVPARTLYLDLAAYLDGARAGSPPFTPAVPAVSALEAALDEVLAEGARAHRERYVERAAVLDAELDGLGLEQLIAPEHRSRSIRSVRLPSGVDFAELHDRLKADGYVIYAGQGSLSSEIFRVACMGALEPDALRGFAGRLRAALQLEPARA
jgi:2-aminoethylphosphonate-pyruvate transaminase